MHSLDALVITNWCFATLIIGKCLLYSIVARRLLLILGRDKIKLFWRHYAHGEHLLAAAWRLGAFVSLLISYTGLVIFSHWKSLTAPVEISVPLCWLWALLLLALSIRILNQMLAEWIDLDSSLKSLLTTLKIKSSLRTVGRVVSLLSVAYPVFAFQGWVTLATWSQRAIFAGKSAQLFERWFDRKVHGEVQQFLLTSIGAAIFETMLKIAIIGLAIFQARNL